MPRREVKAMSDNAMFELADRLKELREAKKAAEEELKSINAEIDDVEYRLSELMISSETQNFTRAGTMFCLSTTTRASAAAGMKEELFDALRSKGFGELIYETVNAIPCRHLLKNRLLRMETSFRTG